MGALELLHQGATLAGEVEKSPAFQSFYKPCMTTVAQLEKGSKRNEMILSHDKILWGRLGGRAAHDRD